MSMLPFYPYVVDRRAWVGGELPEKEDWVVRLPGPAFHRLVARAGALAERGLPVADLRRDHFYDPELARALAGPFAEVRDGRGFVVLRGLPADGAPLRALKLACWGLASLIGRGPSQSNLGDFVDAPADVAAADSPAHGDRNGEDLHLHTDACDMIALMAVRAARRGGDSAVASAFAVHNLFLRERPELLPALYRGAPNHRRGDQPFDPAWVAPRRVPVFSIAGRALSIRYAPPYLADGLHAAGEGDSALIEAMDALQRFGERVKTTFRLEPGEVLLLNNLTTLHARSRFDDWPEPERKRLLLRLKLNAVGFRPIDPRLSPGRMGYRVPLVADRAPLYESVA